LEVLGRRAGPGEQLGIGERLRAVGDRGSVRVVLGSMVGDGGEIFSVTT
jgi:hypothetical protein